MLTRITILNNIFDNFMSVIQCLPAEIHISNN